jgi:broad specificity phosphatase PhoE
LFLVRHGQVESNREFRYVGSRDEPLTEVGREQADRLGRTLALARSALLYSSPLRRTRETAERIAALGAAPARLEARLAEQSFGVWEGLTRDEVKSLGPEDAECLARCDADAAAAPPSGESLRDVQSRVVEFVDELAAAGTGSVILVTHVGPIKALLASALDIPLPKARRFFLDPGTVSVLDWRNPSVLRLFNAQGGVRLEEARWW